MEITVDLTRFFKQNLTIDTYILLQLIADKNMNEVYKYLFAIEEFEDTQEFSESNLLLNLQALDYIKIAEDNLVLRTNGLKLFPEEIVNITFDMFWDKYHFLTKLNKTDRDAAEGYWRKLKTKEKILAYSDEILKIYIAAIKQGNSYFFKARTYLRDKHFNDEYTVKTNTGNTSF